jgi:hypothetical protein
LSESESMTITATNDVGKDLEEEYMASIEMFGEDD